MLCGFAIISVVKFNHPIGPQRLSPEESGFAEETINGCGN